MMATEHKEWDDIALYKRALREGWPLKPEHLALAVDKVTAALDATDNPRDVARLSASLARFHGQNQQAAMADRYMEALTDGTTRQILPPHEVAMQMLASVPEESIVDAEIIIEKEQQPAHQTDQDSMKEGPCSPLAMPNANDSAFGAGVW